MEAGFDQDSQRRNHMKPNKIIRGIAFILTIMRACHPAVGASPASDSVSFGNAGSEREHRVCTTGHVRCETLQTELGALKKTYPVRTVAKKGATLGCEFTMMPDGNKPLLLEIQEVHNRRPEVFGYTVLVNDQEVYFRTYYEMAAGPNHYFVQIDPRIAGVSNNLRVMLRNEGNGMFSIGKMWIYADLLDGLARQEEVFRTMPIIFDPRCQFDASPGVDLNKIGGDYAFALEKVKDYQKRYADTTCYGPPGICWTWGFCYGFHEQAGIRRSIDHWLNLSSDTRMPSQFDFNGAWWGSTPTGPDGLGGYFSDLKYQQIAYRNDTKTYHAGFGDSWISPTFNNEQLMKARKVRFRSIMQYTVDRLAFMKAHGKAPPPPVVVRGQGEDYLPGGDFGDAVRAAALSDGVILNPEDGLTDAELDWMDRNLVRYISTLAKNTGEVVGRDSVWVDRGTTILPEQQLFDNLFFEGGTGPWYPHHDEERRSSFWRSFNDDMWPCNEPGWSYVTEERCRDDYVKANGKLGCANMEWCVLTDLAFLENHYQMGYQFETLHGGMPYYRDWLRQADHIDDKPSLPPIHAERRLLDVNTRRDKNMGPPSQIVELSNLMLPYQKDAKVHAHISLADRALPGFITYRLESKDGLFANDLMLEIDAAIKSATGIEIYGGTEVPALSKLMTLTAIEMVPRKQWTPWGTQTGLLDIGAAMANLGTPPSDVYFLKIVFPPGNGEVWINKVRVTRRWPWKTGHLAGTPFTVKQARVLQLWVQDRAVTERMMEKYRSLAGTDASYAQAEKLFDACRYRSAYRLLAGEISQAQPARYAVHGHGQLGRYPIVMTMTNDDSVALARLVKSGEDGCEIILKTETNQPCHLTVGNLKKDHHYELERLGMNHYRLQPALATAKGAFTADANGVVAMDLEITTAEDPLPLPRSFSAMFMEGGGSQIKVWLQDPLVSLLDASTTLPVADGVKLTRQREGLQEKALPEWPQPMDRIDISLDESGKVTEIRALYGGDRGRIRAFHKPVIQGGPLSNGVIELENGHQYELGYNGWFTRCNTLLLTNPGHDPDYLERRIKTGSHVEISYSPYIYGNSLKRAVSITQPVTTLLKADFNTNDGSWRQQVMSCDNLAPKAFGKDFALACMGEGNRTGSAVFEISSNKPLDEVAIACTCRIITPDAASLVFQVSGDGKQWHECGRAERPESPAEPAFQQMLDASSFLTGEKHFYLRVVVESREGVSEAALGQLTVTGVEQQ